MDARFGARVVAGLIVLVALAGSYRLSVGPDVVSLDPSGGRDESESEPDVSVPGSANSGPGFSFSSNAFDRQPGTPPVAERRTSSFEETAQKLSPPLDDGDDSPESVEPPRESPVASEGGRALADTTELGGQTPDESTEDLFPESTKGDKEVENQGPPLQASAQPPHRFDTSVQTTGLNEEPLFDDEAEYNASTPEANPTADAGGRPWNTDDASDPVEAPAAADSFAGSAPQPDSTVSAPDALSHTSPLGASDSDTFYPDSGPVGLDFDDPSGGEGYVGAGPAENPHRNESGNEPEPSKTTPRRSYSRGTTFWAVAQREYGNPAYQRALQQYNRDHNAGGARLIAPTEETLLKLYPDLCPLAPTESAPGSSKPGIHVVQPGETIFDVARKELGDEGKWRQLYEANQDVLRQGIDLLESGAELRIPSEETR